MARNAEPLPSDWVWERVGFWAAYEIRNRPINRLRDMVYVYVRNGPGVMVVGRAIAERFGLELVPDELIPDLIKDYEERCRTKGRWER